MSGGSNKVPERLINFRVYAEGNDLLGIANVELPSLEAMTDTVSGAGIAGEVETPILGHYGSMTLTLSWRTISADLTRLAVQKAHALDLRGVMQEHNASTGEFEKVPVRISVRAIPKNVELGSFEVGAATDSSSEFEVTYIKIVVNNREVVEIDKYNFIAKFDGEDKLADVRKGLGLA